MAFDWPAAVRKTAKSLLHPAWLMIGFWAFIYALYFLAPITQTPAVSITGTAFVISQILVFCVGSVLGAGGLRGSLIVTAPATSAGPPSPRVNWTINSFFLIGIAGAVLSMQEKILSFSQFSLHESAALRAERAQELLDAVPVSGSTLTAIGFLAYPAGFVVMVLVLVLYEATPRTTRALSAIYAIAIFLLSASTGGRSTIFVMVLFLGLGVYIRTCRGLPAIPKSRMIKASMALLLLCFVGYSALIWEARSTISEDGLEAFLAHADVAWGVTPTASLESLAEMLGQPSLIQNIVSTVFYFTQSVSIVERIIAMDEVPTLLGAYHIDLVAAALRVFSDNPGFLAQGYADLLENDVYGFFTSAWGALYIDFGFFGSYTAALAWGVLAGLAHTRARRRLHTDGFTQYIFWMYSILISFVSPPFGFSNSAVIFIWFLLYLFFRSFKRNAGLTQPLQI